MKIGCIIPTRGERKEFVEHCLQMLDAQSRKPEKVMVMDYKPTLEKDLTERYRKGYEAISPFVDVVVCIEDDDYYHPNYLEMIQQLWTQDTEMLGFNNTVYYHLAVRRFKLMTHNTHSSMFQTALKSGMDIAFPNDSEIFLDIDLWRRRMKKDGTRINAKLTRYITDCIGIKHGIGDVGGKGHRQDFAYQEQDDEEMSWLKERTGEQFEFYKKLNQRLNEIKNPLASQSG